MTPREVITQYLAAARRGDWTTAFGYFSDDIVMHVPGRSPFAGARRGEVEIRRVQMAPAQR
jgi:ketosteroid isomerase-like protein